MRTIVITLFAAATLAAQSNPIVTTSKMSYAEVKDNVLRTAQKVPEDLYSFRPTPEVRTFGQLIAHEADAQYEFCGPVSAKPVSKDIEKTVTGKGALIAALNDAFAYCDAAYARMTDADAATMVSFFGQKMTKIGVLDMNIAHSDEHYGNLVTYMRLKGIVPPSSEPKK